MNAPVAGRIAYPGLRAFKREEFDIFFGRESCVDQMVDILAATRFLAVLGTSGSGKSSLVKTGLLNALELGYFPGAGSNWKIADFRPRGRPIRSLAEALLGLNGGSPPKEHEIEVLAAFLRRGPKSLVEWCRDGNLPEGWNLVLIADQFEELFRYEDYSGRQEAEAFVALLIESAADKSVPVHVVITMRSEYLRQCTLIEGLPEAINRGLYLAPRMTREECRQAIVGPAAVCGFSLEPALVNRLLNDLTDFAPWEAGAGHDQANRLGQRADQLPLMQHVLNLLWQIASERHEGKVELKLADYEAVNGLAGALNRHADEIAATIDPKHADVIDVVFRSLVTGKAAADAIRRPTAFGELAALAGGRRESVAAVVDAFRAPGRNFLVPDLSEPLKDDTIIDISHESLIRQWRRLSQCVVDEARSADVYQQLTSSAERFAAKRGGLLTGLDLANIAAWWRAENPAAAWAARYGGHFDEAKSFLEESEAAEAERKNREDEAQRQLIAGQEAARRSRQLQRLAYGLVGMLLLALCGAVATTVFYFSARSSQQQALQAADVAAAQRQKAEEAAKAATSAQAAEASARAKAEAAEAQALALAETAKAAELSEAQARKKAEEAAEAAERSEAAARESAEKAQEAQQEADDARKRAEEEVLTSIGIFAGSLADSIDVYHRDAIAEQYIPHGLSLAGSFLSQVARSLNDAGAGMASAMALLLDQLRPALAVQDWYARHVLPRDTYSGSKSDGKPVANLAGDRFQLLLYPDADGDTSVGYLTVGDRRTGRIVAGYRVPADLREAESGVADAGAVLLLASGGRVAAAASGDKTFDAVPGLYAGSLDDLRRDPAGGRIYLIYGAGSELHLAALGRQGEAWHSFSDVAVGARPADNAPARIAGIGGGKAWLLLGGSLTIIDPGTGASRPLGDIGPVADARLTDDGRYLLAAIRGSGRNCAAPPPDRAENGQPVQLASLAAAPATSSRPQTPDEMTSSARCLAVLDAATGATIWSGAVGDVYLETARADAGGIELIQGNPRGDLRVVSLTLSGGGAERAFRKFDPAEWQLAGFGSVYINEAATGGVLHDDVSQLDLASVGGPLSPIVPPAGSTGSILDWRVDGDEVVVVHTFSEDRGGTEHQYLELLRYRHDARAIERKPFPLAARDDLHSALHCETPASAQQADQPCRFVRAALSPNGETLLVVTNYSFLFISSDGRRVSIDRNIAAQGASMAEGQDIPTELSGLMPLDPAGNVFLARASGSKLWQIAREMRSASSPGVGPGAAATVSVKAIPLPRGAEATLQDVYTDPASETIYLRSRRSIAMMTRGEDGAWTTRTVIAQQQDQPEIGALAPMPKERLAILLADGNLSVRRRDGGTSSDVPTADSGLRNVQAMSAANERVILDVPQAAVGYRLADGKLALEFIVPGERLEGQLASGEVFSVEQGLRIFASPPAPTADKAALTLVQMREADSAPGQGADFNLGFDILRRRALATADTEPTDDSEEYACEPALMIAVRSIDRGLAEGVLDAVSNACQSDERRRNIIKAMTDADAGGAEGNDGIVDLLRRAGSDELALAALVNSIKRAMPDAAHALIAYQPSLALQPSGSEIAAVADGGAIDGGAASAAATRAEGLDPFDHWLLALQAERQGGGDSKSLTSALFHYALAERLLKAVGAPVPDHIRDRRIALSRILSDQAVLDTFDAVRAVSLTEEPPPRQEQGAEEKPESPLKPENPVNPETPRGETATLEQTAAWLAKVQAGAADPHGLDPLVALVEEALGKASKDSDKAAAVGHFRRAMKLFVGSLEDVQRLRNELLSVGDESAYRLAAAAILFVVDRSFTTPIVFDVEARREATAALDLLAKPGEEIDGIDLAGLKFGFLEFDWGSRNRAVDDAAREFLDELSAAERFFTAELDKNPGDTKWLALRGRVRFWLSTLSPRRVTEITEQQLDDWAKGALTDLAAAEAAGNMALWDRFLLAEAYSAAAQGGWRSGNGDWLGVATKAADIYRAIIAAPDFASLDRGRTDAYHQRLVFNGLTLILYQTTKNLQGLEPLAGFRFLPTDSGYDRAKAVDQAYDALAAAEAREDVVAEARRRGLVQPSSKSWDLDRNSDHLWGYTIASIGAAARIADGANGTATACDEMGVHVSDVERPAKPVGADRLKIDRILDECPATSPRNLYYRARALSQADWDAHLDEFMRLLISAAREGLIIAYHNLSVALTTDTDAPTADERWQVADSLWTTYADLTLTKAYPDISGWLLPAANTPEHQKTFAWIAGKAAALGVAEAHRDLGGLAGASARDRALHLKIAAKLFTEAGRTEDAASAEAALAALALPASDMAAVESEAVAWQPRKPTLIDSDMERRILDLMAAVRAASR